MKDIQLIVAIRYSLFVQIAVAMNSETAHTLFD